MRTILILTSLLALSACNTWHGAGEDLNAGYHGVKRSAERSQARNEARQPMDWTYDTPHHQAGRQ